MNGSCLTNDVRMLAGFVSLIGAGTLLAGEPGSMTREIWLNLQGGAVTDFTATPRYWQSADSISIFSGAAAPSHAADAFASRVRAYVTAPISGAYTFWIASDDSSELWLSPTDSKFGRVRIASVSGWVNPQAWDAKTSQKSAQIQLVAGQRYFIEALHKDGGGADHFAIAWQTPGGVRELIPVSALESFAADPNDADNDELRDDWELEFGFNPADSGAADPSQLALADPDHDGYSNLEESEFGTNPNLRGGVPGTLLLETWSGVSGIRVEELTYHPRYAGLPNKSEFVYSAETPANRADNYGARMRGYLIAPTSGEYTFYLAGDDDCQLWLSPSGSQFARHKAAWINGWTNVRQWTKYSSQKSQTYTLQAGQRVYLEAIQKESGGGDHLEIGWQTPGSTTITVIPGSALESYAYDANDAEGDNMPDDWESLHGLDPLQNDAAGDPDRDGIPNHLEWANASDPQVKNSIPGALLTELWLDVPGYHVEGLTGSARFLQQSDYVSLATSTQTVSQPYDAFGSRLRGYVTAPVTGTYTFWVQGDDETELRLSPTDSKFAKQPLVRPTLNTNNFDTDFSQKSRPVSLVAGQKYYIEILHKDYYGGDFCQIAWTRPGASREIISGAYLESFSPVANDQDDDDLPDDWETANGFSPLDNGSINPANGAQGDLDGDGLTNAEEHTHGTRADLADTDGDGVSDRDEIEILETQALAADVAPFQPVVTLDGSDFMLDSGSWFADQSCAVQGSSRGWIEYGFSLNTAGVYQAEIKLAPKLLGASSDGLDLVIDVDGQRVGRIPLRVRQGIVESVKALTPWLGAGPHKLRVFVDNAVTSRRMSVQAVTLLASRGPDGSGNGVPDWVDARLMESNSIECPSESPVSPLCLGGKSRWSGMVALNGAAVQDGPCKSWFSDVPLDPQQPVTLDVSFENHGLEASRQVSWIATNLLSTRTLTIRRGDSLKLTAFSGATPTSQENVIIEVEGQTLTTASDQPVVFQFMTPGNIPIQVDHTVDGSTTQFTATVVVVESPALVSPVCVTGHWREWDLPPMPPGVVIEMDPDLVGETISLGQSGTRKVVRLAAPDDHVVLARLWSDGPVIGSTALRGMRVRSGAETSLTTLETVGGVSRVEMPVVINGLWPDAEVRIEIFIGGVTFSDGSLTRTLSLPGSCDAFGTSMIEFLKVGNAGATCHRVSVWQGGRRIAWKQ